MSVSAHTVSRNSHRASVAAGLALLIIVFFKNAWICDDAYIIFRSLEQLFEGNGPRWNPHERVQVFTSPLWFWFLSIFRIFARDAFLVAMAASVTCMAAFIVVTRRLFSNGLTWLLFTAALTCSSGFFDFTTSGLENPLCYTSVALFALGYLGAFSAGDPENSFRHVTITTCAFGAALICRLDIAVLLLPPLIYLLAGRHGRSIGKRRFAVLALSLLPVAGWTVFSTIYYGSPLPNTAYAKLGASIPLGELIPQGSKYIGASFQRDTITGLLLFIGALAALLRGKGHIRPLGIGIIFSMLFVISVGGDFMQGRFLSYAYLMSVIVLAVMISEGRSGQTVRRRPRTIKNNISASLLTLLAMYAIFYPGNPVSSPADYSSTEIINGIADERGFYFRSSSIHVWRARKNRFFPAHPWTKKGYEVNRDQRRNKIVVANTGIGYFGYWAGTETIIIDPLAISDPFLARMPVIEGIDWRPGHFRRDVPEWYVRVIAGQNAAAPDPEIASLHSDVVSISREQNLLSMDRLEAVSRLLLKWK